MKAADTLLTVAGLGLVAWVLTRDASSGDEAPMGAAPSDSNDPNEYVFGDWDMTNLFLANEAQKLSAFLYMIRHTEHSKADADSGAAYHTFYGGSYFDDLSDHPVLTGEKVGVPLSDAMCKNAGLGPGCVSTAAGAYQITKPTWGEFRVDAAWGNRLEDFSPASQDETARRILMRIGALPMILAGDIERAIYKASARWASLPGSTAKQGAKSIDVALSLFQEGLSHAMG